MTGPIGRSTRQRASRLRHARACNWLAPPADCPTATPLLYRPPSWWCLDRMTRRATPHPHRDSERLGHVTRDVESGRLETLLHGCGYTRFWGSSSCHRRIRQAALLRTLVEVQRGNQTLHGAVFAHEDNAMRVFRRRCRRRLSERQGTNPTTQYQYGCPHPFGIHERPALTFCLRAMLHIHQIQCGTQALGELLRIIVRPEVHEEEMRGVVDHMTVERGHFDPMLP
jgi:hypothetical protein